MGEPAEKRATYRDVLDAPSHVVAEVLGGRFYTHARPRVRHARAGSRLAGRIDGFDDDGAGGPSGRVILIGPELHLGEDIVAPDLAGWRRERLPELPDAPYLELAPDWVCEVISPSTEQLDRAAKVPLYARERVEWVWLLDPDIQTLEIFHLDGDGYRVHAVHRADAEVRAEPFDAIAIPLAKLWGPPRDPE